MSLVRLTLKQNYLGEDVYNVFHYATIGTGAGEAQRVAQAFETQILPDINAIQNGALTNVSAYALNLGTLSDYWTESLSGGGGVNTIATANPRFLSFSFTMTPSASVIRHGYKRIAAVDENFVLDGQLNPFNATAVNTVATALMTTITNVTWNALPCIVRNIGTSSSPSYVIATVIACVFKSISTQNTRK